MKRLPSDIVDHIKSYLFGKCWLCSKMKHCSELKFDYKMYEYRSVFDDEYGFEALLTIPLICDICILTLNNFEMSGIVL